MNPLAVSALAMLPDDASVLDCGAWFKPLPRATHVLDLMPYETREGRLQLAPQPGERFTKSSWFQVDFLSADLRLPFPDAYFSFCHCSHTLEDLAEPEPLLNEMRRVSRSGLLVAPSRLLEQTAGIRDRITSRRGHPHHHWILDTMAGRTVFAHKGDSLDGAWWRTTVPLFLTERIRSGSPAANDWIFPWVGSFEWEFLSGPPAGTLAEDFARRLGSNPRLLALDWLWRQLRRLKHAYRRRNEQPLADWWQQMIRLSQPFSSLPLK